MRLTRPLINGLVCCLITSIATGSDYSNEVAPILNAYCAGCHNDDEAEGELSLESFASLQKGGEHGAVILPGDSRSSRLMRLITGEASPKMPPEDNEGPSDDEIRILRDWIDAGAKGPEGIAPEPTLRVPQVAPSDSANPITAVDWSPDGRFVAVARIGEVELRDAHDNSVVRTLGDLPGKVNSVVFSADGRQVVGASGVAGLSGVARLWNTNDGELLREFRGHRDAVQTADLSPDQQTLATGSYDQQIILWDAATGKQLRVLTGHNGAIYDVAFDPSGSVLASASGDDTVKLWNVSTGERLDTLSQPLAEQFTVTFSPDGQLIVAGGADNRIRVWEFVSRDTPKINPLIHARFAHEEPIVDLEFSSDGNALISAGEDRVLKVWETKTYSQVFAWERQADVAVDIALDPTGDALIAARMDGSLQSFHLPSVRREPADIVQKEPPAAAEGDGPIQEIAEQEPNDDPAQAVPVSVPVTISGTIHVGEESRRSDADVFRFHARAGEQWLIEVNAAQSGSPLDSRVEVLTADGERIERMLLEAVRDSWFNFRGKDSTTTGDFRVHNWEEMELNEYLYANGEVVRLWLYPRGPDSGFKVYPGDGDRYTYFDTTAITHALNSPCYIVRPHRPGTPLIPKGLPVFTVYYENDDDSRREIGTDSRLLFTAPDEADYLVRLVDARGFQEADYHYKLTVRRPLPGFSITVGGMNPKISPGTGREFSVTARRIDGYEGPIQVDIDDVPPGFFVTSPLVIEAGQNTALGTIFATPDAVAPTDDNNAVSKITATAEIAGRTIAQDAGTLGTIALDEAAQLIVRVESTSGGTDQDWSVERPLELEIRPGETIDARVVLDRRGFTGEVSLGKEDSGRNLPHGVYVDNIGLNGLAILEGQTQRTFFITAAKWVPPTTRTFHLQANVQGNVTSLPVVLHVRESTRINSAKR